MAKLSAHGRELVRLVKQLPDSDYFDNCKDYIALYEDRRILTKHTARHKPDSLYPNGQPHSWGWKLGQKVKMSVTVEQFKEYFVKKGYTIDE